MLVYIKIKWFCLVGLMAFLISCTSDFREINTNPNKPIKVSSANLLAYVLSDFTGEAFNMKINGGESGYANQIGKLQYMEEAVYAFREGTFNDFFATVYRDQQNLQVVLAQSENEGATNMKAAAMTFSAYIWLIATDMWRDIPFSDALGASNGVLSPSYDTQEDIYPAVMNMLKEANDLFNEGATDKLGDGDLLFNGNLVLWQKFANSLRLRMAMRVSNVDPATSKRVVEQILGNPVTYPIISSNEDNAYFGWTGADPYYEPFYYLKYIDERDQNGMADVIVDRLKEFNDPRLLIYAEPAASDGEYRGVIVGDYETNFKMVNISRLGEKIIDNAAGFSPFMNYAEVCFIIAEASEKGWNTGMTADAAYKAGITASMKENNVSDEDIATYLGQPEIAYKSVNQIYLQRWLAVFKNGHEAWAETRRTDVPLLSAAPDATYTGHNRPPFRQPYPTNEYSLNQENIQPYWDKVEDRLWGQQMYWDTRIGVK
jgi:hypothetical protein